MDRRLPQAVAGLSLIAFTLWLGLRDRAGAGLEALPPTVVEESGPAPGSDGSQVPCAAPLAWRVERLDPRFGLGQEQAEEAVRAAANLWESAVGRSLFVHDRVHGLPLRFVYDARQQSTREMGSREKELAAVDARLDGMRAEVEAMEDGFADTRDRHEDEGRALEARFAAHNDSVRFWNERGGAPDRLHARLRAAGDALDAEARALKAREAGLEAERQRVLEARRRLQDAVDRRNLQAAELQEDFPPRSVEDGLYRETVESERDGRVVSVEREIWIYRFEGSEGLRRILAHELGHALGLGHTEGHGDVMSERFVRGEGSDEPVAIRPADLALLRKRCPGLVGG